MSGGQYDSSMTRVAPVFDALTAVGDTWPQALLELAQYGSPDAEPKAGADFTVQEAFWGRREQSLDPPVALLSWLIRNVRRMQPDGGESGPRGDLLKGDRHAIGNALRAVRESYSPRGWFIFEGPTVPDAYVVTKDALIVVEGKRTESGPTTMTKWMPGRHQIWRHIDAAWEIRGDRRVYGLFIVDSPGLDVPEVWRAAAGGALSPAALEGSFPHRSATEIVAISRCFLGVTTWRRVCARFGLSYEALPDTVAAGIAPETHSDPDYPDSSRVGALRAIPKALILPEVSCSALIVPSLHQTCAILPPQDRSPLRLPSQNG